VKQRGKERLKHLLVRFPLLVTLAGSVVWAGAFNESALSGSYVLTLAGSPTNLGPVTGLGLLTFDGSGGVSGFQRLTLPDCQGLLSGSYYVNADGSGVIDLPPFGPFIFDGSRGPQLDAFIAPPNPSIVSAKLQQRPIDPKTIFSLTSFSGFYVWSYNGRAADGGQVAGTGTVTSDGRGNVSVTQSFHDAALGSCNGAGNGTYSISHDGSGELSLQTVWRRAPNPPANCAGAVTILPPPRLNAWYFVLDDAKGKSIDLISDSSGYEEIVQGKLVRKGKSTP
jgi:hypothetical protein